MSSALEVTRAYLAFGEALKNLLETHDRVLSERDEALKKVECLTQEKAARDALSDLNRAEHFADLRKGIPLPPTEDNTFKAGDLAQPRTNGYKWEPVFKVESGQVWFSSQRHYNSLALVHKPIEVGDTVRTLHSSFIGRVKTIEHNQFGVTLVWFTSYGERARLSECVAIDPECIK